MAAPPAGSVWVRSRMTTGRTEVLTADVLGNWRLVIDLPRDTRYSLIVDPVAQTSSPYTPDVPEVLP